MFTSIFRDLDVDGNEIVFFIFLNCEQWANIHVIVYLTFKAIETKLTVDANTSKDTQFVLQLTNKKMDKPRGSNHCLIFKGTQLLYNHFVVALFFRGR